MNIHYIVLITISQILLYIRELIQTDFWAPKILVSYRWGGSPELVISSKLPGEADMLSVRQPHTEKHSFKQFVYVWSANMLILPILLHWLNVTPNYCLDLPTEQTKIT